ncbi:thiamine pyrophosphate-binding protein [Parapusillimonas granuli]|uniref:Thiamine pyrophosphate-binding protein n=1 Tax=Parapusillimonas granuli TaxID=380911 RepID=A0A853G558_9BURK|nr:thiamine pyrophosphate-binding protein [Parapusillimonas granuli]MBB5216382.1 acetolactate synthase-1/2/3 large subunit [Parapusillimonas granuli]MEB2399893.1 thiamine pyrophosphate-binding protein [Alcaligenaceae bacterium]NYT51449.1 thiamine pyrophosphate-binding protein [Parapusillimonas granuli]
MTAPPRGADLLARALRRAGVETVFSLSGNHVMPVYDALYTEKLGLVHTRHEGAAVHMADAHARLTGRVAVALVTGGPGHANAVSALYTAYMSESPVVLLSGHAPLNQLGRGAFQEMDQVAMARPVVKQAWAASDPAAIAQDFARACRLALSGRPGPVHLSLPTDVLEAPAAGAALPDAAEFQARPMPLSGDAAHDLLARLRQARRPLILAGPQGLTDSGRRAVQRLQDACGMPVIATESPRGGNDPALGAFAPLLAQADCVLLLGKRLDFTLGFGKAPAFADGCVFLQADADEDEFRRSTEAVGDRLRARARSDFHSAAAALADAAAVGGSRRMEADWPERVRSGIAYRPEAWRQAVAATAAGAADAAKPAPLHPAALCAAVQPLLDSHPDAVLVVDGGEFGQWAQACLHAPHRVINGAAGAIGAALPMAIGAKHVYPDAPVVALMGDGTFGFHCAELDTALRCRAPILCVVGNDARWNAEYQIQLRSYGAGRAIGCELLPSRYDRVAAAFGGHGEHVDKAADLPAALARAAQSGLPACVNVALDGLPAPVVRRPS